MRSRLKKNVAKHWANRTRINGARKKKKEEKGEREREEQERGKGRSHPARSRAINSIKAGDRSNLALPVSNSGARHARAHTHTHTRTVGERGWPT